MSSQQRPGPPAAVSSFSAYFDTGLLTEEVLRALGYTFAVGNPVLPRYEGEVGFTAELADRIGRAIPHVTLTSEAAKREFLVAPLLLELAVRFGIDVRVEYSLEVTPALRGSLDYLLEGRSRDLVVIEAKLGDLYRGFRQLAAELVAVDQWTESDATHLYGAVTLGDAWRFGVLDRAAKRVTQDIALFRVPADLEDLTRVLLGALLPEGGTDAG
jgi:hypothetical protein